MTDVTYKRYAFCENCPKLGLSARKIGWTGVVWLHVDTTCQWCVRPYYASPGG